MNAIKRPLSIFVLACLYITVGAVGLIFHFHDLVAHPGEGISIELTELLAVIAGAYLFRGHNWARWLALVWIAFHVVLSVFHPVRELVLHSLLCFAIAWILFRPAAGRYFRSAPAAPA